VTVSVLFELGTDGLYGETYTNASGSGCSPRASYCRGSGSNTGHHLTFVNKVTLWHVYLRVFRVLILVKDLPLCFKYNNKVKYIYTYILYIYIYVLSRTQQCFYCISGYQFRSLRPSSGQCYTKLIKAGYMQCMGIADGGTVVKVLC
jgi:hypothetical protein